jgi:2'-5' RNA ligase
MTGDASKPATRRLFVAVNLPSSVREAIRDAVAPLADAEPRAVAWTREPNLHLTMRFLGDRPETLVDALSSRLADVAATLPAFDLALHGLGAFPTLRRPRVLWIGVEANVALARLYQKVDAVCTSLGVDSEPRPFHPHVTIGRVRIGASLSPVRLDEAAAALSTRRWSLAVSTVDLMSSELGRGGSQYTRLSMARLGVGTEGGA